MTWEENLLLEEAYIKDWVVEQGDFFFFQFWYLPGQVIWNVLFHLKRDINFSFFITPFLDFQLNASLAEQQQKKTHCISVVSVPAPT